MKDKFQEYYEETLPIVEQIKADLESQLTDEQKKLLEKFQTNYRSLCEHRQRVYDLENFEEGFGFLKEFQEGLL